MTENEENFVINRKEYICLAIFYAVTNKYEDYATVHKNLYPTDGEEEAKKIFDIIKKRSFLTWWDIESGE